METEYVPYAQRNNVSDLRLHPILNYIERVLAWDILLDYLSKDDWLIYTECDNHFISCVGGEYNIQMYIKSGKKLNTSIHQDILLDVFSSLLPVIRDKSK